MLAVIIGSEMCHIHRASVRGRKLFHSKCISWSYRNRGYDARIHRKVIVNASVFSTKLIVYSSGVCGCACVHICSLCTEPYVCWQNLCVYMCT